MMKLEFDKMEKYWSNKLANERKLYEDHIQQNDTKIHDWEHQIGSLVNNVMVTEPTNELERQLPTITE